MAKIFPKPIIYKEVHMMSLKELQEKFKVDVKKGLSSEQAKENLENHRKNQTKFSYFMIIKEVFFGLVDYFSILLWISLILFIILFQPLGGDPKNFINVGLILFCFGTKSLFIGIQTYKLIKVMRRLQSPNRNLVMVLRDSRWHSCPASDLVVGDVVKISANQRVPADLRIFLVNNLRLDKSIVTGESEPINASDKSFENIESKTSYLEAKNMAFTNFLVTHGQGQGIVVTTGNNSVMNTLAIENVIRNRFSNPINKGFVLLAYALIFLTLLNLLIYILVWLLMIRTNYYSAAIYVLRSLVNISVTGFPVSLPVSIIIGLFLTVQKLRKSHIVVKDMFAITSMSGIDVVLTDKTGTLTRNELEVANVFYSTKEIDVELCSLDPDVFLGAQVGLKQLLNLCDFCTCEEKKSSSVEHALLRFARKNMTTKFDCEIINEIEFSSNNKYQARLVRQKSGAHLLMIRGAPDLLLPKCKRIINADHGDMEINATILKSIEDKMEQWSLMGRRLMCLCKKPINEDKQSRAARNSNFQKWFDYEFKNLTFVGLIGFTDPLKPDIKESVAKIREMGIRVVMVTGDYSTTAASIATQVGILSNMQYETFAKFRARKAFKKEAGRTSILLNGSEIDRVSSDDWRIICRDYTEIILSRATPNHKLICVKQFQANQHSVLMVGDGFNDVPALKRADLSVVMESGSKIASDLSSVVLLNNLFGSIHELLTIGRQTLINVRKIFIFSISCVFSQYIATLLTSTLGIPQLYSNLQMTLVSALVEILPSVSLFFEKSNPAELKMKREAIFNARMLIMSLLFLGPLTTFLSYMNFFLYFKLYAGLNPSDLAFNYLLYSLGIDNNMPAIDLVDQVVGQTVGFYSIVIIQLFGNLYSIRTKNLSLFKSLPFFKPYRNWIIIASSVLVCAIITILVSFSISGLTMPIPIAFYGLAWACSLFSLFVNEIVKLCLTRFRRY